MATQGAVGDTTDGSIAAAPEGGQRLTYGYYVVGLLSVTYMLSFMDRTLISLLIEPIKSEFALSDTQIGALIGFGFVIFRSEEHTSELQSLMRISYAVFFLKKKKKQ